MAQGPQARPRNAVATTNEEQPVMKARAGKVSILDQVALRLEMDPMDLQRVLKATVFQKASNEEFAALLIVCNAYKLNPITKEIYAFPTKGGGIMPMVSIDGWIRIVNEHPHFRGVEFNDVADDKGQLLGVECTMYRTDRDMPTRIIEYLSECQQNTDPWKKMPARMNRHKAFIQCARYTFGFSGIYDETDASIMANELAHAPPMADAGPPPRRTQIAARPDTEGAIDATPTREDIARDEGADTSTGEVVSDASRDLHPMQNQADDIVAAAKDASTLIDLNGLRERTLEPIEQMPEEMAAMVNQALDNAEKRLKGGAK